MKIFSFEKQRVLLGRLEAGDDLLLKLKEFCELNDISAGAIFGLGALRKAVIGYYDQPFHEYKQMPFERDMEIASLNGNISKKDGGIAIHCHIVLGDEGGECFGGHVMEGCEVFACEFTVIALEGGAAPERKLDEATGLNLW